jgi:hypothetical protein
MIELLAGKKTYGIIAIFILCILAEKGLAWDIPGFVAPADWLNQVIVALGLGAGRSTIGNIISAVRTIAAR